MRRQFHNAPQHLPRLQIGDAARRFGLTARAIRFYEEEGLIEAGRDRGHNRVFDGYAQERLRWISLLRHAGVPLAEVRQVLGADSERQMAARALDALASRRCTLEAQLNQLNAEIAKLAPPGLERQG